MWDLLVWAAATTKVGGVVVVSWCKGYWFALQSTFNECGVHKSKIGFKLNLGVQIWVDKLQIKLISYPYGSLISSR